jgi:glycosyltransferase involved in cell wall biosynthesis
MAAGGSVRTGQLARFLPEHGWAVTVLTVRCAPTLAVDAPAVDGLPEQVVVHRAPGPNELLAMRGRPNVRRGLAGLVRSAAVTMARAVPIPDRQIGWYPGAVRLGRRLLDEIPHDVVLASFGPATSAIVGARLARDSSLPFVLDYRDLWSDTPHDAYLTDWHRRLAARHERACVRTAARVTCVSERMANHVAGRHGRSAGEVVAIPNGFDPEWVRARQPRSPQRPLRLVYTGAIHRFQSVEFFLEGLRTASGLGLTPDDLEVVFVGNLDPAVPSALGLDGFVRAEPFVPHRAVRGILDEADFALLIERPGYRGEFSYSAKTFDYAAAGIPVLALIEEESNSAGLLRALGTAMIVPPESPQAIAGALLAMARGEGPQPSPVDITAAPLSEFNRHKLTGRLAGVLEAALAGRAGS